MNTAGSGQRGPDSGLQPAVYAVIGNILRYQHPVYWILLLLIGWAAWVPLRRLLAQDPDRAG